MQKLSYNISSYMENINQKYNIKIYIDKWFKKNSNIIVFLKVKRYINFGNQNICE